MTLATNNATRTIAQYVDRLSAYGVNVEPWQIVNSAIAAAQHLHNLFPRGGAVYTIGEEGLIQALAERGFFYAEENVLAVVVGMDRKLTYEKLRRAYITHPERSTIHCHKS